MAGGGGTGERERLRIVLEELSLLAPRGPVTPEALDALRRYFQARQRLLESRTAPAVVTSAAASMASATASAAAEAATLSGIEGQESTPVASGAPPASASPATGVSLQAFLAERSILLVSYAGAFLLIVATLLFELYGASAFGGPLRFAAVLALDLVFGAAGWFCLRRPALRVVGTTYVAIFALMVPLVFAAAYVFLVLKQYGLSAEAALALAGISCAAIYAILAARLRSAGYAWLSLLALPAGAIGAITALDLGVWSGAAFAPMVAVYSAIRRRAARPGSSGSVFFGPASVLIHLATLVALAWMALVSSEFSAARGQGAERWTWTATLGLATLGYLADCWLGRQWDHLALVAIGVTLTALAASNSIGWGETGALAVLVGLAWLYALAARRLPNPRWSGPSTTVHVFRALAALQLLGALLVRARPDWAQAGLLLAAAALGLLMAWDTAEPGWLLLTALLFSVDWYWLVRWLVPPPPNATVSTLVLAYSPLPVLWAVSAVVVGRIAPSGNSGAAGWRWRSRWAWPLYLAAGANATWIVLGALLQPDATLLGRLLLVYAALGYAAAAIEAVPPAAAVATVALLGGILSLLVAQAAAPPAYPLILTGACWAIYGAGMLWERALPASRAVDAEAATGAAPETPSPPEAAPPAAIPPRRRWDWAAPVEWSREHRFVALAAAFVTACSCVVVPEFNVAGNAGGLAALASLWGLALMLLVDGRRHALPLLDYAAGVAVALGSYWIARYAGATNPQWYVTVPGLWLVGTGYVMRRDARLRAAPRLARWPTGAGMALLLGTTALQTLNDDPAAGAYTMALVLEAVALLLVGVAVQDRTLVLGSAAGIAVGAFRALFIILQTVPLFVVFGITALVLLALGALLAALRSRTSTARTVLTAWRDWQ